MGEFVLCKEELGLVVSIKYNNFGNHGYSQYWVKFIDKDKTYLAFRHELEKCDEIDLDDDIVEVTVVEVDNADNADNGYSNENDEEGDNDEVQEVHAKEKDCDKKKRHVEVNAEEVEEIAGGRTADATKKKTKWAVKTFKGIYLYQMSF